MGRRKRHLQALSRRLTFLDGKIAEWNPDGPSGAIAYILAEQGALRWAIAELQGGDSNGKASLQETDPPVHQGTTETI